MAETKPLSVKRSFLEPLPVPKAATKANPTGSGSAASTKASPNTSLEWLQLASQLLIASGNSGSAEDRVLLLCEEVAGMLLEDDAKARRIQQQQQRKLTAVEAETAVYSPQEGEGVSASAAPGAAEDADVASSPSTERLQAAYLLTAASLAAVEAHRLPAAESAVRLARAAVEAYRCPMTAWCIAGACVHWGTVTRDAEQRSAAYQTALTVIASTCKDLLAAESMTAEPAGYAVRIAWMLVEMGAVSQAREPLTAVLQVYPQNYMALLLLTLLHTVDGDYESASAAVMHLLQAYPTDVAAIVVHAAVQQRSRVSEAAGATAKDPNGNIVKNHSSSGSADEAAEELAVAMARIVKLHDEAALAETQGVRKKSLKGLCTHCAPDEDVEGGPKHSYGELRRRVVGHWALLSHVATRLGCTTMAEVAIAAGTDLASQSRLLYYRSFADLQCSQARLSLVRLREAIAAQHDGRYGAPTTALVRDMNLLGQWELDTVAADSTPMLSLPLTATASEGLSSTSPLAGGPAHRLISSKLFDAVSATLLAALEAHPNHAEGHTLFGVTRLLEAAQADLPSETRHNRLQEAGRHFFNAMRADGAFTEAYTGAGVVAEAQGATSESFDYYASAAAVAVQAPLIPWGYFSYLYE
ncbi:hypothetical protein ABB37_01426 [Leptomonas pyrrhocoris]|uniref:Uncharacterized protein n=1 Tax=Leptomonas pyrrhocoris TaxID=157538 RepID=A0A0M9G8Q7_LEPPY|nr:hypothetical protein ABB37_01426 [Leptomonas pyrrhocoris]KPA84993.1 hypothetical protein ABB37_01426 [Leptomonas pyrrhocoris]|eukprot:XP_015663432.1 hypothetical protein ABB37_01426 [Leptomonas pyrrhocoris]